MEPTTMGIIGAAGISLMGGLSGQWASAKQASKARTHDYFMSSTAHQREVADLRAAGLNPILSGTGGMGARGGGGGSMAPQADVVTPAINTALAARRNAAEIKNIDADTLAKDRLEMLYRYQGAKAMSEREGIEIDNEIARTRDVPAAKIEGRIDRPGGAGEWQRELQRWLPMFNSAGSAARGLRRR